MVHYREILNIAAARNTCAPTFDCAEGHLELVRGILEASKRHNSPAIFLTWGGFVRWMGFKAYVELVDAMAKKAGVPFTMFLDHSHDENEIKEAVKGGFTAVMFDVEKYGFEEGAKKTKALVKWVHSKGAIVESSFSSIGREHADGTADKMEITTPEQAVKFVEATGTDMLCPAVGNQHGVTTHTMPLNWPLMESLAQVVKIPMVLHGGSGVAIEDITKAARLGFRKINLFTRMHSMVGQAMLDCAKEHPKDLWLKWAGAGKATVETFVEKYLTGLKWDDSLKDL